MSYLYLPPNANVLSGRTVTSMTGTPDSDHPLSNLTDQRPAFPIRYPSGAWGVSISVASAPVQLVVLANHSLDAAVTVGGDLSGTITPGTPPVNGILRNPFLYLGASVAGVTTITLAGTNTNPAIVGEAFAGVPTALRSLKMADTGDEYLDNGRQLQGEWRNIPMHDDATEWRRWTGSQIYQTSERDTIVALWEAQRGSSLPGVLILDSSVQDARVVSIEQVAPKFNDKSEQFLIELSFIEYPRYRWT